MMNIYKNKMNDDLQVKVKYIKERKWNIDEKERKKRRKYTLKKRKLQNLLDKRKLKRKMIHFIFIFGLCNEQK